MEYEETLAERLSEIEQMRKELKDQENCENRTYTHFLEENSRLKQQKAEIRVKNRELEREITMLKLTKSSIEQRENVRIDIQINKETRLNFLMVRKWTI